jgi:hypothetical protein
MAKSTRKSSSKTTKGKGIRSPKVSTTSKSSNAGKTSQPGGKPQSSQAQAPQPEEKQELTVDGSPYAPISMQKVVDKLEKEGHFDNPEGKKEKSLTVFVNNSGNGFEADHPGIINVMIQDRIMQTTYFVDEVLPNLPRLPAYLYRYVQWVMVDDCKYNGKYDQMRYSSDNDYIMALSSGILKQTDKEYQEVYSMVKWAKSNTELTHLVGLLQLVGGTLRGAAKKGTGIRMYIELPETGFHPKRERLLVTLLYKLKEEYGIKADWTET